MPHVRLVYRIQLLLEVVAVCLFLWGFFTSNLLLTNIGGGYLIITDVAGMLFGALRPGLPIIATILVAPWFAPWWYGAYWVSAVFSIISLPVTLSFIFVPPLPDNPRTTTFHPEVSSPLESSHTAQAEGIQSAARMTEMKFSRIIPFAGLTLFTIALIAIVWHLSSDTIRFATTTAPHSQTDSSSSGATKDIETRTASTAVPTPTIKAIAWERREFADGILSMEYPKDAEIHIDSPGLIEVNQYDRGYTLRWEESVTGQDIANIIESADDYPDFPSQYMEYVRTAMAPLAEAGGQEVVSIGEPEFRAAGDHRAIVLNLEMNAPVAGQMRPVWLLVATFDCASYVCQIQRYIHGKAAPTVEDWKLVERVIESIQFSN